MVEAPAKQIDAPMLEVHRWNVKPSVSTLLPARVLRRDTYNPYTQTLSLNSSDPTRSLLAASESRVYASSFAPGFRATSQLIPFVPIHHRIDVASEAISYAHQIGDQEF